MMPVSPDLLLRPVGADNADDLLALLNPLLLRSLYCYPFTPDSLHAQLFAATPHTIYPVRWQARLHLGAWRAGCLVGFVDAATGLDTERHDQPDDRPLGLLRFLALSAREEQPAEVATALLQAAEAFWLRAGTRYVQAFHLSTGYPVFQAGAGMLPSDWHVHFQLLTAHDYRLQQRYQGLVRPLAKPVNELFTQPDVSLEITGDAADRRYLLYHRRVERVGGARVIGTPAMRTAAVEKRDIAQQGGRNASVVPAHSEETGGAPVVPRIAHLVNIFIEDEWRGRDIGKLLLCRLLNDATQQGFHQMIVYLPQGCDAAWSLFIQHGFQEFNYRGYTLDKMLLA